MLNTQQYKVRIKCKVEQSWEKSCAPLHFSVVAIEKGAFLSPSTTVANFTLLYKLCLRLTKALQKQRRKFLVFLAKVPLLTAKSQNGFKTFILVMRHLEMNPDQYTHLILKYFKTIGEQSTQKYSRISTWLQHIQIHNLLLLKHTENE